MKKNLMLFTVLAVLTVSLAAESNYINPTYNINYDYQNNQIGVRLRSLGLAWTYQGGEERGFHFRANPYMGAQMVNNVGMYTWLIGEDSWTAGSNFLVGYGVDINLNSVGFILGGGLYTDMNYYSYSENRSYQFTSTTGIGANVKFYYQPWKSRFLFNAGIVAAWTPFTLFNTSIFPGEWWTGFYAEQFVVSLNFGFGWRTGPKKPLSER